MKKILLAILLGSLSVFACACGNNPTQNELQQSENIQEVPEIVKTLQHKIDKALESEPTYDDLVEIRELYNDLLKAEQEQIINYDKIEAKFTLSQETVGCIYAINELKNQLKNPNSLSLISAKCIENTTFNSLYIKIEYSAENNVGGTVEDTYYCMIEMPIESNGNWSCKLDDVFASYYRQELINSALGNNSRITSQQYAKEEYEGNSDDAIEVNINQIMDNINIIMAEVENE